MADYQKLFEYDETTNDQLGVIVDYLNEQPGAYPVTVAKAIRYAIAVAAMGIISEARKIAEELAAK